FRNVRWDRWLRAKKVRRVEPGLRDRGLIGAALYYDAQTDDARLVIATVRGAMRAGALAANYVETTGLLKADGRIRAAVVRDALTGETATIRAQVVVNATGPWSDQLRRLDDPLAAAILRLTKGAHVTVARRQPDDLSRHGTRCGRSRRGPTARAGWTPAPAACPDRPAAVAGRRIPRPRRSRRGRACARRRRRNGSTPRGELRQRGGRGAQSGRPRPPAWGVDHRRPAGDLGRGRRRRGAGGWGSGGGRGRPVG